MTPLTVPFYKSAVLPTFNAMEYGAVANFVSWANKGTDTTDAIRSAVDACYAAGGGTVYLPAGNYYVYKAYNPGGNISGSIRVRDNVTLRGAGQSSTFIYGDNPNHHPVLAYYSSNIAVRDMTVVAAGVGGMDAVKIESCDNVLVDHVTGGGASGAVSYGGIAVYGGINNIITSCTAAWTSSCGFSAGGIAEDYPSPAGHYGLNVTVTDCVTHNCNSAFRTQGYPLVFDAEHLPHNITYTNCSGTDNAYTFRMSDCNDINIIDCSSTNCTQSHVAFANVPTGLVHGFAHSGTGWWPLDLANSPGIVLEA